jgi:hypothetical protein
MLSITTVPSDRAPWQAQGGPAMLTLELAQPLGLGRRALHPILRRAHRQHHRVAIRYGKGGAFPEAVEAIHGARNRAMPKAADFRVELRHRLQAAQDDGRQHFDISAGELHRAVGGYPEPDHRVPMCCSVMRQEQRPGDAVVSERPTDGPRFTIRYRLPR